MRDAAPGETRAATVGPVRARPGASADDDLFRPTIKTVPRPSKPPYPLLPLITVGVFGGPYGTTALALLNARRLGGPRRLGVMVGLVGLAGVVLMSVAVFEGRGSARAVAALPGLLTALAQLLLLRGQARYWSARGVGTAPVLPAALAAVAAGVLATVATAVLAGTPA